MEPVYLYLATCSGLLLVPADGTLQVAKPTSAISPQALSHGSSDPTTSSILALFDLSYRKDQHCQSILRSGSYLFN